MFEKIRSFIKSDLIQSSGVYTLSSIFEKAIPFLLLPILTRYLSTEDYGIVSMFTVLVGLTTPFAGLGIKPAVLRSFYKEEVDFPLYVSNALLIIFCSSSVVLMVFFFFSDLISNYSEFPSDWVILVVVVSSSQFIINIVLVIWQAQDHPIPYGLFKVSLTALNMGLSVFLIVALSFGWEGKVIGKIVAVVIFSILGFYILWKNGLLKFQLSLGYIKHALQYGIPLIPHIISGILITYIDRLFITNMVGINETGIYTVGYQVGMIIIVLASSFNKAWSPWFYKQLDKGKDLIKKKIVKFTYLYFVIILVLAFLLAYFAPWFMEFFVGEEFQGATKFIIWIALGYAFKGMYFMVTCYIFYVEKTHILSILTFVTALLNTIFNYILIGIYGAIGAAVATTLSYFCLFVLVWIWASQIYKMPWSLKV